MKYNLNNRIMSTLSSIALTLIFAITYHAYTSDLHLCESYVENNLFYTIQETGLNTWNVLFRNVNVLYQVTAIDTNNQMGHNDFRFRQTGAVDPGSTSIVEQVTRQEHIRAAVMDYFNEIQRGNVHPNLANSINPNAHGKGTLGINSPLDQFAIKDFFVIVAGFVVISITSMGIYLTFSAYWGSVTNLIANNYNRLAANSWSISMESIYATVLGIVTSQINNIKGQRYFPLIYVLFVFILVNNLVGMIPYSFSPTSHFALTFFISFTMVGGSTLLGLQVQQLGFFSVFVPSGCPLALLPLLVLIEFISYIARNVSLGLRLGANILSGHMLLNILGGFTYKIAKSNVWGPVLAIIPAIFIGAFCALELGIAFIQAQVFCVLSSSYIKDGLLGH